MYYVSSAASTQFVVNESLSEHQLNVVSSTSDSSNPYKPNDLLGVSFLYEISNSSSKIANKSNSMTNNSSSSSNNSTVNDNQLSSSSSVGNFNTFSNQSYSTALSSTLRSWNKLDYWCNLCVEPFNSWNEHIGKKEHVIFEHLYELLINLERRWDVAEVCSELVNWEKRFSDYKIKNLETLLMRTNDDNSSNSDTVSAAPWGNSYPRPWHTIEHDVMLQKLSSMQTTNGNWNSNQNINKEISNRALKKLMRRRNAVSSNKQKTNSITDSLRDLNYPINHVLNEFFLLYEESTLEKRHYEIHACLRYLLDEKVIDINQKNYNYFLEEGSNVLHRRIFPMFAQVFPRAEAKELTALVQSNLSSLSCAVLFYQCHLEVFITPELRDAFNGNNKSTNLLRDNNKSNQKRPISPLTASRTTPRRLISINSGIEDTVRGYGAQVNEVSTDSNNNNTFDKGEDDIDNAELNNPSNEDEQECSESDDEDNITMSDDLFENRGGRNSSSSSLSFWLRSSFVRVLLGALRWAVDEDSHSRLISSAYNVAVDSHYYIVASHLAHLILSEFTYLKSAEYVTRVQKVINRPEGLREMQTTRNSNNSVLGRAANRLHRISFQGKASSSLPSTVVNTTSAHRHEVVPVLSNWGTRQWIGNEAFFNASFGKLLETRGVHKVNDNSSYGMSGNYKNNTKNSSKLQEEQQIDQSNRKSNVTSNSSNNINLSKAIAERNVKTRVAQFTSVPANEWPRRNTRSVTW